MTTVNPGTGPMPHLRNYGFEPTGFDNDGFYCGPITHIQRPRNRSSDYRTNDYSSAIRGRP